jgi:outer membrane protein assembly factor BamB
MSNRTTSAACRRVAILAALLSTAAWGGAPRSASGQMVPQNLRPAQAAMQQAQQQALQQALQQELQLITQQAQQAQQRVLTVQAEIQSLQQQAQAQQDPQRTQQYAEMLKALQQSQQQAMQQAQLAAQRRQAVQQQLQQMQNNMFAQAGGGPGILLPTDRAAGRRIEEAEELLRQQQYSEAVGFLGGLLEGGEDLFYSPASGGSGSLRSIKAHVRTLIGSLPPAGRETYQLQFGARAQRLLDNALASGDVAGLEAAARQYLHTDAGYQAAYLVALSHLDHNRSLAAALEFQKLASAPQASARFGPTLDVLAATSWLRAGIPDRARQTLVELKAKSPGASVQIGGRDLKLFDDSDQALDWLATSVGSMNALVMSPKAEWTMFRGDPARNATSGGGRPLLSPRWRVRMANHPALEKTIESLTRIYAEQGLAALPAAQPLATSNVVVVRSLDGLVAVDLETGKRIWEVRPRSAAAVAGIASRLRGDGAEASLTMAMHQRMWQEVAFGNMSSDGERVYFLDADIPEPSLVMAQQNNVRILGGQPIFAGNIQFSTAGSSANVATRLVAVDIETEGKLVWEAGGPDDRSDLAGASFLGAPLPLGGLLYSLVELNNGVRLVALDAKSGKLEWSQHLADLEASIWQDFTRRTAGAVPSYADGVMICPLTAGVVLAVDLVDRSLLWAYHYPRNALVNANSANRGLVAAFGGVVISDIQEEPGNRRWVDSSATIVDGRVILTPSDSDLMHCLNLINGELEWTLPRGGNLYVAGVRNGKVAVVGVSETSDPFSPGAVGRVASAILSAVDLADGRVVDSVIFSDGARPSGRGYMSEGFYFLPLSSGEVAQVDLESMTIVQRARSREGAIPGNLICYQDQVISQGFDFVEAFYQVEPLRERATALLRDDAGDAEALARMGEILLDEGELNTAIDFFRRSYRAAPNDLTKELLITNLLVAMRDDFSTHRDVAVELEGLIEHPAQRNTLLRLLADGMTTLGDVQGAFTNYLKLIDMARENEPME